MQITSKELSEKVGVGMSRIRQRVNEMEKLGLAEKKAGRWFFDEDAVAWLKADRPRSGMRTSRIGDGVYEITGAPVRGFDWKLIRKPGQGTYASIAGPTDNDDDEQVVIEEYSDPDHRAIWDGMHVAQCASAAHAEIMDAIQ
jgi:hypothetical protein